MFTSKFIIALLLASFVFEASSTQPIFVYERDAYDGNVTKSSMDVFTGPYGGLNIRWRRMVTYNGTETLDGTLINIGTSPFPRIVSRHLNATNRNDNSLSFDWSSHSINLMYVFDYKEVNNVPGYQSGDTYAGKSYGLGPWSTITWPTAWTNYTTTDSGTGNTVYHFSKTTTDGFMRIGVHFSEGMYTMNGTVYYPEGVKFDVYFNMSKMSWTSGAYVGIGALLSFTSDIAYVYDNHTDNDNRLAAAKAVGNSTCTTVPDFRAFFSGSSSSFGFMNWARNITLTDSTGASSSASVIASGFKSGFMSSAETAYTAHKSDDATLNSLSVYRSAVFSIDAPISSYQTAEWDPEQGSDTVNEGTSSTSTSSSGKSGSSIAQPSLIALFVVLILASFI